ncbi:protein hunchback [Ixodes scapularis]|uniref:protein hunchback n=1 Tax=Ixodes scapularis TaxID=6945 RepID=UPI001A9D9DC0|nr:protein hunchback [Ixodes scapularis]
MRTCEVEEQEAWARDQRRAMAEDGARDRSDASMSCDDSDDESSAAGNPLAQLQNALQKTGLLGATLEPDGPRDFTDVAPMTMQMQPLYRAPPPQLQSPGFPGDSKQASLETLDRSSAYRCHLCPFQGSSKAEYSSHIASHLDHKCPLCDYRSRTEGRLKRHVKDFHSEEPWSPARSLAIDDGKERTFRCRQCGHVAQSKTDFWEHSKVHIKTEKLLSCPKCPFVTEYKHHLEYHLRNHFGSKPFKCPKCNYSCVNKSMLNSHLKSHSNVYQYRCADCTYATKYCHSLKLHLRKYMHRPAGVLNNDGSPNLFPVLDVYGTRRGPRRGPRPDIQLQPPLQNHLQNQFQNQFQNQLQNQLQGPLQGLLPAVACAQQQLLRAAVLGSPGVVPWKCSVCDYTTADEQQLSRHVLSHAEGQDLCRLYGIRSLPAPPEALPPTERAVDFPFVSSTSSQDPPLRDDRRENRGEDRRENRGEDGRENRTEDRRENRREDRREDCREDCREDLREGRREDHREDRMEDRREDLKEVRREDPQEGQTERCKDVKEDVKEECIEERKEDRKGFPLDLSRGPVEPSRSRRKGRAFRLDRLCLRLQENEGDVETPRAEDPPEVPSPAVPQQKLSPPSILAARLQESPPTETSVDGSPPAKDAYRCVYCDIAFEHCVMYTVHMGYHGYHDPFTCNMCGQRSEDKLAFFLHIARAAHL